MSSCVRVCVNYSQTRRRTEYGSGGGTREENDRHGGQGDLGNILLPTFPCLGEDAVESLEENNLCVLFLILLNLCLFTCFSVWVQGSVGTGVQVLSVSHSGIKLLKTVKSSAAAPDYFRVLRPYTYVLLFVLNSISFDKPMKDECIPSLMCLNYQLSFF